MDMHYLCLVDQVYQRIFEVQWSPGLENISNYHIKHFNSAHHSHVRPYYLHLLHSPKVLSREKSPSSFQGGHNMPSGYEHQNPLPWVPIGKNYITSEQNIYQCT